MLNFVANLRLQAATVLCVLCITSPATGEDILASLKCHDLLEITDSDITLENAQKYFVLSKYCTYPDLITREQKSMRGSVQLQAEMLLGGAHKSTRLRPVCNFDFGKWVWISERVR